MGAMTVPRISVRLLRRWLRPALAAVLLINGAFGSPAIAGSHAMAARAPGAASADSVGQHCPAHEKPGSGANPAVPAAHTCCDEAGCGCTVAFACLAVVGAPLGDQFARAPLIAEPTLSANPLGSRSPVFRPPIAQR